MEDLYWNFNTWLNLPTCRDQTCPGSTPEPYCWGGVEQIDCGWGKVDYYWFDTHDYETGEMLPPQPCRFACG